VIRDTRQIRYINSVKIGLVALNRVYPVPDTNLNLSWINLRYGIVIKVSSGIALLNKAKAHSESDIQDDIEHSHSHSGSLAAWQFIVYPKLNFQ